MLSSFDLDVLRFIQSFRTPALDSFFKCIDYFDSNYFYLALIVALWQGYSRRAGVWLFYILSMNTFINIAFKTFFARERPFHLDPSLGVISAGGYSLPSGAAQVYMLLSCLLIAHWKSRWRWPVALGTLFLVSLSRVYLGVHYPTDILAGWFVGFLLFLLIYSITPAINRLLERLNRFQLFLISEAIPIFLLLVQYSASGTRLCFTLIGVGLGLFIGSTVQQEESSLLKPIERVLRAVWGIFGLLLFLNIIRLFPASNGYIYFSHFLIGIWFSLLADFFKRLLFKIQIV